MYYSSSLLKRFISVDDTVANIANNLILKSCEIEEIVQRKIPEGVVIGYTTKVEKHPEADKLFVCQVDCGDKGNYQILCGAKNVTAGLFVPVALPGTYLPAIDLKIDARKMRGLDSNGMICAKAELGIKEDEDQPWIWILTEDFEDISRQDLGVSFGKKYAWLESRVMDVDNKGLTHRPDLTGHFGVATEIYAIYQDAASFAGVDEGHVALAGGHKAKISSATLEKYLKDFAHTNIFETLDNSDSSVRKVINKSDDLREYILMEISDVKVEKSSFYTRLELLDLGLAPRNNWVDFSNLFMSLTGQPVHFFDAAKVDGDIVVRYAQEGERFVDLFEKEHELSVTDLVIADKNKILALAGVVGGLDSGVTDMTTDIIVEIANFDSVVVRKTGTRLGLRTDAELRYEKNINPVYSLYSLLFFLDLIKFYHKDLGEYRFGGLDYFVSETTKSMHNNPKQIEVDLCAMTKLIFGEEVDGFAEEAVKILEGLGFEIIQNTECKTQNDGRCLFDVKVPIRRGPGDMNIQEDVFEEVARIYGYNRIEPKSLQGDLNNIKYSPLVDLQRRLESFFVQDMRFDQMETYPWVEDKLLDLFGVERDSLYSLENPPSDAQYMRNSLGENLISYVSKNAKFFDEIRVFDIGKVWSKCKLQSPDGTILDERYAKNFVGEKTQLGAVLYRGSLSSWEEDTLLEVKNIFVRLCEELELVGEVVLKPTEYSRYHPKKQMDVYVGEVLLGFIGSLHPIINKSLKMPENASVTFFSLYVEAIVSLLANSVGKKYSFITLKDQIVSRDLCFVVESDKDFSTVMDVVNAVEKVSDVEVFDLYKGENLPKGKKSIAFKFKIVGEGNMTTEDINKVMDEVISKVEKEGAELRK